MNVLGISGSCRPQGNTDTLVRLALQGAEREGAATRLLRLSAYLTLPCHGCMACVFKNQECAVKDRFPDLVDAFRWADAVVLGSPAYVLGANSLVKNLHDRTIRYGMTREFAGKPGVAVVAAGVPGWTAFSLPQVSLLFLLLGMPVVDQFIGYAQGPGEVVFDPGALDRAWRGGAALGRGERGYLGEKGACPVCHFDLISVAGSAGPRCVICDLPGDLCNEAGTVRLEPRKGAQSRLSEISVVHHYQDRIVPSGPRFRTQLREIRRKQRELGLEGGRDEPS